MNLEKFELIKLGLPRNFRIQHKIADMEGPGEMIFAVCPPDSYYIQHRNGFFKPWYTIGEVDPEEMAIYLYPGYWNGYYGMFYSIYALTAPIKIGTPGHKLRYFDRLAAEGPIASIRFAREVEKQRLIETKQ